jgi:superfamily II DNA or RNA helicase
MALTDLINDRRTSIDSDVSKQVDRTRFGAMLRHLEPFHFWTPPRHPKRKPLYEHQRTAIETVLAYLAADPHIPERPTLREAALLKLPTGTGKSGIVTVLARCLPDIKRILVLTPRKSLVAQMKDDVRFRFWGHLDYSIEERKTFTATAAEMGRELRPIYVDTLLPARIPQILAHTPRSERTVLVGTYQALDLIRRQSCDMRPNQDTARAEAMSVLSLLKSFDLVLVDEGHYEPAISWSKGVRELNLPTVLLSATPYRNDFKSFRVRGNFVFNYPYQAAVGQPVIRNVELIRLKTQTRGNAVERFVAALAGKWRSLTKTATAWTRRRPKIMVRAADLDTLYELQKVIDRTFGAQSVVVHDRAVSTARQPRRYNDVRKALEAAPDAEFWLHQFKLMEGVDDPDFVAVALFDPPGNARQLIQQIGRVVRLSAGRIKKQTAAVLVTEEDAAKVERTLERYRQHEEYCAEETRHIVANEIALPDRVLERMPLSQYIDGQFRKRFDVNAALSMEDLQLSTSAAVFEWDGPDAHSTTF